ncbi:MAG TPA: iron-sulfur cluster assembly accessory protein [Fimbriiglobus sp.]|jgi:iron-sulfur cluster assembly protein
MATAVAEETKTLGLKDDASVKATPRVTITPKAASEVKRIMAEQASGGLEEKLHLRLRVVGGGCSGFQHKLDLDPQVNEKLDDTFELEGVPVVVDKRSALYLDGVVVDFHDDLNKRGFSVDNANAKSKCGCGSSFSM